MRIGLVMAGALLMSPALQAEDGDALHQAGVDRFGGTYQTLIVADFNACAALCARDSACQAWSYKTPVSVTLRGTCELKSSLGVTEPNLIAVSGISPALLARWSAPTPKRPSETSETKIERVVLAGGQEETQPVARTIPLLQLLGGVPLVTADPVDRASLSQTAENQTDHGSERLQVISHDKLLLTYGNGTP